MPILNKPFSDLRLAAMASDNFAGKILKLIGPLLDRLLGINKLRIMYAKNQLQGLDKQTFSSKLLTLLGVKIHGAEGIIDKIPKEGRCIIVCNHPYGMIEGVIIANFLTAYRSDTKIMANVGLQIFKEISDYFIFANPLNPKAAINTKAIKQCFSHVKNEGLLVIFPAGKVSSYQEDKQIITDAPWNRLAVQIATKTNTPILPVFISGTNSSLFHFLGRIYYRLRLLMLVREMLKLQQHKIEFSATQLITPEQLKQLDGIEKMNDFVRLQCYLNDKAYFTPWSQDKKVELEAIIPAVDQVLMAKEIADLPEEQHLLDFKNFSVYYGYQQQIPNCVKEITRLREIVFRMHNEGSGKPCDTDKFDATYIHIFIFDHEHDEIIGAYRMGQTDILLKDGDISALYLSQMFNFEPEFINQQEPCLEMGRSFVVEKHQNSFYGLLLLLKGIGHFAGKNPRYKTLYGTVSLSKLYNPRSVSLINKVMVNDTNGVTAKAPFKSLLHPEVNVFFDDKISDIKTLSEFIKAIETDGKDVPILLKQYHKLGAKFHCMGIDLNFNETPGLLLSVNLTKSPTRLVKLYVGEHKDAYLNFKGYTDA